MAHRFGFWTLLFLVIANMIGAGVFTTSGFALADLGSPSTVVLAWVVGGLIALAGAYSYGRLVQVMPESGGEYLFLSRAAHPLLGFIAGWVSLIAGFSGAIAFAATALEGYVLPAATRPAWLPTGTIAVLAILLSGIFHGLWPRWGALLQNSVVLVKLGLLLLIIGFGWSQLPDGAESLSSLAVPAGWEMAAAFATSLVWISLSYSGFNAAVYIAGEVDQPQKTVPRALLSGTLIVLLLYALLNTVFVFAAPAEQVAGREDVAAVAAFALGGDFFATFVRWTIAVCLLTSVLSMMMAAPRVYAKMADDGYLPRALRFQGDHPLGATVMQVGIAVLLVIVSSLQGLLSYLGLTLSLSAACSVFCLLLPSLRHRSLVHPVHWLPITYITCTVGAAAIMCFFNPWQLLGTGLTISIGAAAYFVVQAQKGEIGPPQSPVS